MRSSGFCISPRRPFGTACAPPPLSAPIARKPHHFSFHDLLIVRTTKGLLEAGISVGRIRKVLASLKRQLPDDQMLSGVKIFADGHRVVVWDATGQWQPDSGQFLLDFDAADVNRLTKVRPLARPREKPRSLAQQWYERARNWNRIRRKKPAMLIKKPSRSIQPLSTRT